MNEIKEYAKRALLEGKLVFKACPVSAIVLYGLLFSVTIWMCVGIPQTSEGVNALYLPTVPACILFGLMVLICFFADYQAWKLRKKGTLPPS